jgi:hypothetical protein
LEVKVREVNRLITEMRMKNLEPEAIQDQGITMPVVQEEVEGSRLLLEEGCH